MKQACGLGMLIGRGGARQLARLEIHVEMALTRPVNAIRPSAGPY